MRAGTLVQGAGKGQRGAVGETESRRTVAAASSGNNEGHRRTRSLGRYLGTEDRGRRTRALGRYLAVCREGKHGRGKPWGQGG